MNVFCTNGGGLLNDGTYLRQVRYHLLIIS